MKIRILRRDAFKDLQHTRLPTALEIALREVFKKFRKSSECKVLCKLKYDFLKYKLLVLVYHINLSLPSECP